MKKGLMIGGVVLLLLLAAGGGFLFMQNSKAPSDSAQNANTKTQQVQTVPTKSSVISSIKDALLGSGSFTCNYKDENGLETASYIKNGMVRVDVTADTPDKSGSVLMRDKKFYSWTAKKEGFMLTLPEDVSGMVEDAKDKQTSEQQKEMIENLEKYKESCKQTKVSDSMFAVPTDVKFTDMSAIAVPTAGRGVGAQPSIDQKQFEEMMKQYAPQDSTSSDGQ